MAYYSTADTKMQAHFFQYDETILQVIGPCNLTKCRADNFLFKKDLDSNKLV